MTVRTDKDSLRSLFLLLALWLSLFFCPAWSEDLSAVADLSAVTNSSAAQALPSTTDLRPVFAKWGLWLRKQGRRPTCSVLTLAGAMEFAMAQKQQCSERLSVEFLNWTANQATGRTNDGGNFTMLWKGYETYGICKEQELPYRARFDMSQRPTAEVMASAKSRLALNLQPHWIKRWNVHTGLTDEQFLAIKRTLNQGWPVCCGLRWPKHEVWTNDVLQMCPPRGVFDGHSVLFVGYRDDPNLPGSGVFIIRNTDPGRDGYMPYIYARAYMNDAVWINSE